VIARVVFKESIAPRVQQMGVRIAALENIKITPDKAPVKIVQLECANNRM
jgi:hypothetical protein